MRFQKTIHTDAPETLTGLQPGQWIDYAGTQGRFMGIRQGVSWIAWGKSARKHFVIFAAVFNGAPIMREI